MSKVVECPKCKRKFTTMQNDRVCPMCAGNVVEGGGTIHQENPYPNTSKPKKK